MITPAQIAAENVDALTQDQILSLLLLVRQYEPYKQAIGKWPDLEGVLQELKTVQSDEETRTDETTSQTKALKAVLTAYGRIPSIVVESEGTDESKSFFTTKSNWDAWAQDILNILYDTPTILGAQNYAVVHRRIKDLKLTDDYY